MDFPLGSNNHFNLIGGNKLLYASILIGCCILVWAPIDLVGWPKAYFNQGSTDRRLQGPIFSEMSGFGPWNPDIDCIGSALDDLLMCPESRHI